MTRLATPMTSAIVKSDALVAFIVATKSFYKAVNISNVVVVVVVVVVL